MLHESVRRHRDQVISVVDIGQSVGAVGIGLCTVLRTHPVGFVIEFLCQQDICVGHRCFVLRCDRTVYVRIGILPIVRQFFCVTHADQRVLPAPAFFLTVLYAFRGALSDALCRLFRMLCERLFRALLLCLLLTRCLLLIFCNNRLFQLLFQRFISGIPDAGFIDLSGLLDFGLFFVNLAKSQISLGARAVDLHSLPVAVGRTEQITALHVLLRHADIVLIGLRLVGTVQNDVRSGCQNRNCRQRGAAAQQDDPLSSVHSHFVIPFTV